MWRHQCFSIDFVSGNFVYVLNGVTKYKEENIFADFDDDLQQYQSFFNFIGSVPPYQKMIPCYDDIVKIRMASFVG